ncbi:MAG: alpha/beta fold hydrolase [Bacteroidota bacterium]
MKIRILNDLFVRHNELNDSRQSIWFLHGFGDSGLVYKEVFDSVLNHNFNLYVVDLPGFGVSPLNPDFLSISQQAELLSRIISIETHNQGKVNLVAHSLGALIGTWICQALDTRIHYFFNIEGNLTEADSYFSSKPLEFTSATEFVASFEKEIFERAKSIDVYKQYYCSLRFASPEGMRNWSLTSQAFVKGNRCGHDFKNLLCKKVYIWGDVDTSEDTQYFLDTHEIPSRLYVGVGHWHMVENAFELYRDMNDIIISSE